MRIEVLSDERLGEGGFLRLRRLRLRNVREDGSRSRPYLCDYAERPKGLDAVAVVVFARNSGETRVLLRDGLRPPLEYGRARESPHGSGPDGGSPWSTEIVAGILEAGDEGEEGVRRRAAIEVEEEAGYRVSPKDVQLLGAPVYPCPGVIPELLWLAAVEVDESGGTGPLTGDGSPMEEGASIHWLTIEQAIESARDAKTELGARRLRDWLDSRARG